MADAKPVVDLDKALGLSRDAGGSVIPAFKYRFIKVRFPSQKVKLSGAKIDIEFRVTRQNDVSQGAPVGVFETNDDAIALELAEMISKKTDLCIVRAAT